jgi:hypothetical protein
MNDPLLPSGFFTGALFAYCSVLVVRWFAWMAHERTLTERVTKLESVIAEMTKAKETKNQ